MIKSENINLIIPEINDQADITAFNENWEIIDSKIKETTDRIESTNENLTQYIKKDEIPQLQEDISTNLESNFISTEQYEALKTQIASIPDDFFRQQDRLELLENFKNLASENYLTKEEAQKRYALKKDYDLLKRITGDDIHFFGKIVARLSGRNMSEVKPKNFKEELQRCFYDRSLQPLGVICSISNQDFINKKNQENKPITDRYVQTFKSDTGGVCYITGTYMMEDFGYITVNIDDSFKIIDFCPSEKNRNPCYPINYDEKTGKFIYAMAFDFSEKVEVIQFSKYKYPEDMKIYVFKNSSKANRRMVNHSASMIINDEDYGTKPVSFEINKENMHFRLSAITIDESIYPENDIVIEYRTENNPIGLCEVSYSRKRMKENLEMYKKIPKDMIDKHILNGITAEEYLRYYIYSSKRDQKNSSCIEYDFNSLVKQGIDFNPT